MTFPGIPVRIEGLHTGAPTGNKNADKQLDQSDPVDSSGSTAEEVAEESGVSEPTVIPVHIAAPTTTYAGGGVAGFQVVILTT